MEDLPKGKAADPPKEMVKGNLTDDPAILESGAIDVSVNSVEAAVEPKKEEIVNDVKQEDAKDDKKDAKNGPQKKGKANYQRRRYGYRRDRRGRGYSEGAATESKGEEEVVNGVQEGSPKKRPSFNSTCTFCRTTLKEPKYWRNHLCGDKHQSRIYRLMNFELTKDIRASVERSIRISGYPLDTPQFELFDYFGSYGPIQNFFYTRERNKRRHCVIEYKDAETMKDVLEMSHFWKTRRIDVIKHNKLYNGEYSTDLEDVGKKLEDIQTFTEQAKVLISELELSDKETKMRTDLALTIQEKFRSLFPGCTAEAFGSSVNSLGVHECDLDVFVDLALDDWSKIRPLVPEKRNEDSPPTVPLPSQRDRVRLGARLLRSMRNISMVVPIPSARVPILKFRHTPNNLFSDVSFRNPMSVCNTKLIYEFASLDTRIRELMMMIRYWDSQFGISSKGRYLEMTKYALTMLVVFMMQNISPRLLPSVKELQSGDPKVIEGWNVGFSVEFDASLNDMSLKELALKFFTFYAEYDFKNLVVCPYLGKSVPKTDFLAPETLSKDFELYTENLKNESCIKLEIDTAMCVQDPFELSLNITRQMGSRAVDLFQKSCKDSKELFNVESEKGLLMKILTPSPEAIKERETQKKQHKDVPMQIILRLPKECTEEVIVEAVKHALNGALLFEIGPLKDKHQLKKAKASSEKADAAEAGNKADSVEAESKSESTEGKAEPEPDSAENNSESSPEAASELAIDLNDPKQVSFTCSSRQVTWEGRLGAFKRLGIPMDQVNVENERKITDHLVETSRRRPVKTPMEFICSVRKENEQTSVSFSNLSLRNISFRRLRTLLRKLLPPLVEQRIKELES